MKTGKLTTVAKERPKRLARLDLPESRKPEVIELVRREARVHADEEHSARELEAAFWNWLGKGCLLINLSADGSRVTLIPVEIH
jgi:hypothetical protein